MHIRVDPFWRKVVKKLGGLTRPRVLQEVSVLLKLDYYTTRMALDQSGRLIKSGLIERLRFGDSFEMPITGHYPTHREVDLHMFRSRRAWDDFMNSKFEQVELAKQKYSFPHLEEDIRLLELFLKNALLEQMGAVARAFPLSGNELESALERWLNERLKAAGKPALSGVESALSFDCSLLNIRLEPAGIVEGLKHTGEGRLCLFGPPGTGKTAFARYLADQLDREAQLKRGSDLRSAYVGQTEQNIARMFATASRNKYVLILDEADSFLSGRSARRQAWEVNETSEFLIQLESFKGVFCATTNRFEELDPAFMRRFDMKIELGYLTRDQRVKIFQRTLKVSACATRLKTGIRTRLDALGSLTPGDFITARRKLQFSGQHQTQDTLLSALVQELECKQVNQGRPIGFRWAS